jgi:hypothetical protein
MRARGHGPVFRVTTALAAAAALTFGALQPASAQNIFEQIFSGLHRARETAGLPTNLHAYADPVSSFFNAIHPRQQRAEAGPASAYCVRTCDGHYFPVRAQPGMSAAQACHSFCPASQTRLYSGSNIDYATASDGSRYADLDTAFVFRQHLVAGCTCNGHDVFGLAHIDVNSDPTLKAGDVVATKSGLMAFTGSKNGDKDKAANFTPIAGYSGFSSGYRQMLSAMKVTPQNDHPLASLASPPQGDESRSAQLER